ncbi:hypothetical protein LCGC14_2575610, partial [marine sediment metagenome]
MAGIVAALAVAATTATLESVTSISAVPFMALLDYDTNKAEAV